MTGSFSQLVDYWTVLWQSVGGASLMMYLLVAISVFAAVLAAIGKRRIWPTKPRGFHYGREAAGWARSRFPEEQRTIAAYAAQLMREQFGASIADLEASTRLVRDLGMDDLEPIELLRTCEGDLAITISEEEFRENLATLGGLIEYLHTRVESPALVENSSFNSEAADRECAEV